MNLLPDNVEKIDWEVVIEDFLVYCDWISEKVFFFGLGESEDLKNLRESSFMGNGSFNGLLILS